MDVGTLINQYQIIEHIGRGGMADVWSARDQRLNRMVAVKTIAHGLSQDVDPVNLFKREAQTIAQMEHPHILPIYDFGEFRGKLYIVMRYVAGGSLGDLLDTGGGLGVQDVLRLGTAVASALDYAHKNKIVHLDLKPQNILLDSYQSPYLADFGLATVLDLEGRAQNPGSGTLMYMAPEQLTSEVLDHRADIFSFGVMLYHMFSGRLPFDGSAPLALKQLQFQETLPDLENLPLQVSEILRRACSTELNYRPSSVIEVVENIQAVLSDSVDLSMYQGGFDDFGGDYAMGELPDSDDANLLEAVDLYSRARHAWAGGQGRFLMGVTHFMIMNDYYLRAAEYDLTLDEEGLQMILRGALEYDRDVAYWWSKLDDNNRRWVCLHAIRSGNAPARIRALYRLETLPDAEAPRIPRLVAQALQTETDEQAKLAALQVLGTRARLMKSTFDYDIKTEYRGRMLTTMTRFDLQIRPDAEWQETVYAPEIDLLIAQTALDQTSSTVADFAARIIGRIRSTTAVRHVAKHTDKKAALRALALIRDEAPNLPPVVPSSQRMNAWLNNSWRRVTDDPLTLTRRFLLAMLGGTLAMGFHVYATFRTQAIFTPQRFSNALSFGLAFGVFIGILVVLSDEIPSRLRGFWYEWQRLAFTLIAGVLWGMLTWGMSTYLYLYRPPDWDMMLMGAFGLTLGFVLSTMLNLRGWLAFVLTTLTTYLTVYAAFNNFCKQVFICVSETPSEFTIAPAAIIGLSIGLFAGVLLRMQNNNRFTLDTRLPSGLGTVFSVFIGGAWAWLAWQGYTLIAQPEAVRWTPVLGLTLFGLISGAFFTYSFTLRSQIGFIIGAFAVYALFFTQIITPEVLQDMTLWPTFPDPPALLYYDFPEQIFSVALPFAMLVALGGHAMMLRRDVALFRRRPKVVPAPVSVPAEVVTQPKTPAINENDINTQVLNPVSQDHIITEIDISSSLDYGDTTKLND